MNISTTDAQALFTKKIIAVYQERPKPTNFLRSFFPTDINPTLEVGIEVQRGSETVAVDVERGTDGNRNTISRSTEKLWIPPYYREYLDVTQLQLYDRLFGATEIGMDVFTRIINNAVDNLMLVKDRVERAYELQCAQALLTGIVKLKHATNINFGRKTGSIIDVGAGEYWTVTTADPFAQIAAWCKLLRTVGKAGGSIFNLVMGGKAKSDFDNNTIVQKRQNLFNYAPDQLAAPMMGENGAAFHGTISCGPYRVRLWTYPQYYDLIVAGEKVSTPYIDDEKVILLPENPIGKLAFGAVPQLLKANTPPIVGDYVFGQKQDDWDAVHLMDVKSCGIAVPIQIDKIITATVTAPAA